MWHHPFPISDDFILNFKVKFIVKFVFIQRRFTFIRVYLNKFMGALIQVVFIAKKECEKRLWQTLNKLSVTYIANGILS